MEGLILRAFQICLDFDPAFDYPMSQFVRCNNNLEIGFLFTYIIQLKKACIMVTVIFLE